MIKPGYVNVGDRQVHVLCSGRGPVVVLLHPLPLWSRSQTPLIEALSARCTVLAPDIAGHGLTDPLSAGVCNPAGFARDVVAALDLLHVRDFILLACENAAAIGMEVVATLGARVRALVLNDPCLYTDIERGILSSRGFDEFTPDDSGSHLPRLWDAARSHSLFRPVEFPALANRLDRAMASPEELNELVKAFMRATPNPAFGLRSLLAKDWIPGRLPPTLMLVDPRTAESRLPTIDGARVLRTEATASIRAAAMLDFFGQVGPPADGRLRWPSLADQPRDRFVRSFIPVSGGHLHARISLGGSRRPVIGLHDPAGSHALVMSFVGGHAADRPVIALDMPGNGESDNVLGMRSVTSTDYAQVVLDALDALGVDEVDAVGRYSGGPVAMEMAFARPSLVRHVVVAALALYADDEVDTLIANYTPSVAPQRDGSHLALAWFEMKSQALFWPWFRQTRDGIVWGEPLVDPRLIHQRVFDLLRAGDMYRHAYAALWRYPMAERLPRLRTPTMLCAPQWDPIFYGLEQASRIASQHRVAVLPAKFPEWTPVFARFFDEVD